MKTILSRYFEVKLKNGNVMILSEFEIEQYREYVDNVRTELIKEEIKKIDIRPLSKSNIESITK